MKDLNKYIGVPFKLGGREFDGFDCLGLAAEYLRNEKKVKVIIPETTEELIQEFSQYREKLKDLVELFPFKDLRPDDVAIFLIKKELHVGIYLGYNKLLHVDWRGPSHITRLDERWKQAFIGGIHIDGKKTVVLPAAGRKWLAPILAVVGAVIGAVVGHPELGLMIWYGLQGAAIGYAVGMAMVPIDIDLKAKSPKYKIGALYNTFSNDLIVPLIYGGPIIYAGNIIWQTDPGETVKRFIVLGEGEFEEIADVECNDINIGDLSGCSYTAYLGTGAQTPDARCGGVVKGLRHTAYLALTLQGSDKLKGSVIVTSKIKGRKIKTYSGDTWSGATHTKNPAAILRDYLTLSKVRGGVGINEIYLDDASFGDAYDHCNESVDNGQGGIEARYELSYIIDEKKPALDTINEILVTFNAGLVKSGKTLKLIVEKANETSVQSFTEDNIIKDSFTYAYGKSEDCPNRLGITWISPLEAKNPKRIAWCEDEIDQEERGLVEKKVDLIGIDRQSQAIRQAKKMLYFAKLNNWACELSGGIDSIDCEPGDIIKVTHSRPNWTEALFRIIDMQEGERGQLKILGRSYNSSILDDSYGTGFDDWDYGSPPNPWEPCGEIDNLSLTELGWRNTDGTHIVHIDCSWDPPSVKLEDLWYYQVELKKGAADYIVVGNTTSSEYRISSNLEIGVTYYVRVKTVNINGIISDGVVSASLALGGKVTAPPDISNFAYTFTDELVFTWDKSTFQDFGGAEIRLEDTNWGVQNANLVYRGKTNKFTIVKPSSRTPGTYYAKFYDTSGNFSDNSVSLTPTNSAPAAPTVTLTAFFDLAYLKWTDSEDDDLLYYEVWRSANGNWGGEETLDHKTAGTSAILKVTDATAYFKVRGVDTYGVGSLSASKTANFVQLTEDDLGDEIVTAAKVTTGELITLAAQIKDAIITSAKILNLDAAKINVGTLTGFTIQTAASGSRVVMTTTSLIGYASNGDIIFKVTLSGADEGDVQLGDYAGGNGILWDNSAGKFIVKGVMDIGTAGKVYIDGTNEIIKVYDASNNLRVELGLLT